MRKVAVALGFLLALPLILGAGAGRAAAATPTTVAPTASAAAAAPCGTLGVPTTTIFLPNITKMLGGPNGWVTPFIVQNVGVKKATLEVSFFRFSDGGLVTCRRIDDLAPATSFADYPNNDADLPADAQFSVVVKSFGSEVVSVINEHQGQGQPTRAEALSYNGLTSGATSMYLPFVGKPVSAACPPTDPNCNRSWITTFVMQNFGAVNTSVSARFTSFDGAVTTTLTRTIAPGRSQFIDPTAEPQLLAGRYYSVVITSAQPIGVVVNAHDDAPSSLAPRGFSYNGVPQPTAGDVYLPYVRRDGPALRTYPSGVLVQNAGTFEARPTLAFQRLGGGGPLTITAPVAIKPGATWLFDPEQSPSLAVGEYSLVVTGGTFAVLDATLVHGAAMGFIGASGQGNRAYLPNVTRTLGGARGWTTPIVVQSAGATSATLRWYRFADGALVTRQSIGPFARGASIRVDPRSVPGLSDDTQYGVVVDAKEGNVAALVTELNFEGGDGTMIYEGFAATVSTVPAPTAVVITPGVVQLGTDESAQLTATVKDQFDEVMPETPPTWRVAPLALGAVATSGVFTAGATGGVGAITATAGNAFETIQLTVVPPASVTRGGISFLLRTTGSSDFYAESTVSRFAAGAINTQVNADIARIQQDYGRSFAARPEVYLLATDASYETAQTQIMGLGPSFVSAQSIADPFESAGVYYRKRVAMDLARIGNSIPFTTARHELTHMMIDEITGDAPVPAWLNEGSARLAEFTIPGALWWRTVEQHRAVSMAVNGRQLSTAELTSQGAWNAREGPLSRYQYAEASQIVQVLRNEIGLAAQLQILSLIGAGRTFEESYAAVTGRSWADFAASVPARLRALATSPGIAFAADSTAGAGPNGPTFVIYGYAPNTSVTLSITGAATGFTNSGRFQVLDEFGVYWSWLGTNWPADTYTFTLTASGAPTITKSVTKAP
ncbi:MAG TPA: hypothetical protein VJ726_04350 [Candidatus Limnocylindria bacterium]|nr:hypothetical protein [Candidatus Limnocylindria bacterium]